MRVAKVHVRGMSRAWLGANQGRVLAAAEGAASGELVALVLGRAGGRADGQEVCATFVAECSRIKVGPRVVYTASKKVVLAPAGPLDWAAINGLGLGFGTG